jgi:myosin heavy subunit
MEYLTFVCSGEGPEADDIKTKLLESNPVLEAFGAHPSHAFSRH